MLRYATNERKQQAEENADISRKYSKFKEFYIDD